MGRDAAFESVRAKSDLILQGVGAFLIGRTSEREPHEMSCAFSYGCCPTRSSRMDCRKDPCSLTSWDSICISSKAL